MKNTFFAVGAFLASVACVQAQQVDARTAYQMKQALAEVPRLVQQFDQIQASQESLAARMNRLEASAKSGDAKSEVAALRADLAELKRRQDAMRGEIVAEITRKLADLLQKQDARIAAQDARIAAAEKARPAAPSGGGKTRKKHDNAPAESAAPAVSPTGKVYNHVVEPGQTLSEIARGYGVTVGRVLEFNPGLKPERLKVGQTVVVPEK